MHCVLFSLSSKLRAGLQFFHLHSTRPDTRMGLLKERFMRGENPEGGRQRERGGGQRGSRRKDMHPSEGHLKRRLSSTPYLHMIEASDYRRETDTSEKSISLVLSSTMDHTYSLQILKRPAFSFHLNFYHDGPAG